MAENQASEEFQLTLSGAGIDIRLAVSPQKAALIMNVIMGMQPADAEHSPGFSEPKSAAASVRVSLREFLDGVKASKKLDQIVAIGHYMGTHEGQATFSRDQVKTRFAAAREPMPSNFSRDFGNAIKSGMIAEDHKQAGHYYVTKTGIHALERHFGSPNKS